MFVYVKCACGTSLRASRTGTESAVRCWNCGEMVKVRRSGRRADAASSRRRWDQMETAAGFLVVVALLVGTWLLPRLGPYAALAAAFLTLRTYIGGPDEADEPRSVVRRFGSWIGWLIGSALLTAAMMAPFILGSDPGQLGMLRLISPVRLGIACAAFAAFALAPLVIGWIIARNEAVGSPTPRPSALGQLLRRPFASLAVLLALPLAYLTLEAVTMASMWSTKLLAPAVYDTFPLPSDIRHKGESLAAEKGVDLNKTSTVLRVYEKGVRQGTTLVGSMPPHLSYWPTKSIKLWWITKRSNASYLLLRMALTLTVSLVLVAVLWFESSWFAGLFAPPEKVEGQESPSEPTPSLAAS